MEAGLALAIIFFSFLSGAGGIIATLLLYVLLGSMNKMWQKQTGRQMSSKIFKRGLLLASGPILIAVFSAIRIFLVLGGQDVGIIWQLLVYSSFGVYCLMVSTFIFSMFDELNTLYKKYHDDLLEQAKS